MTSAFDYTVYPIYHQQKKRRVDMYQITIQFSVGANKWLTIDANLRLLPARVL
jgi:hypothetical protein